MRTARSRTAAAARSRPTTSPPTLIELDNGASGVIALNRSAWGRKGRIFVQLFGAKGTIVYDQERMNEVQLYTADGAEGDARASAPFSPRRIIRPMTSSFRRRAMGSASTI